MFLKGRGNCFYDKYFQDDLVYNSNYDKLYYNIDYRSVGFRIVLFGGDF